MAKFKIKIGEMKEAKKVLSKRLEDLRDEEKNLTTTTKRVDTSWNDNSTLPFIVSVESDEKSISKLDDRVDDLLKEVDKFIYNLEMTLSRNGISKTSAQISYDEVYMNKSISLLTTTISSLNDCYNAIQRSLVSCRAQTSINRTLSSIRTSIKTLDDIKNKMLNISSSIEANISESKNYISKLDDVKIKDNGLKFVWSITPVKLKFEKLEGVTRFIKSSRGADITLSNAKLQRDTQIHFDNIHD